MLWFSLSTATLLPPSMETAEPPSAAEPEEITVSLPRGGPIYSPHLVGPLSRIYDFEVTVLQLLQELKAEVSQDDSPEQHEEDISVDDLKVFSDEQLVGMAMEEAVKGREYDSCSSPLPGDQTLAGEGCHGVSTEEHELLESSSTEGDASARCLDGFPSQSPSETVKQKDIQKKRKRTRNNQVLEINGIGKLAEVMKIKDKQEEARAVANTKLHSLSAVSNIKKSISLPAPMENVEKLTTIRSTNCTVKVKPSDTQAAHSTDIVLCVEVYHNRNKGIKTQEFLVLGQQMLTELRDMISCTTDLNVRKAGMHDPSGYFLIEDLFCNDLRDPSAINYSEPILEWLRNSKEEVLKKWECIVNGELQQKQKAVIGDVSMQLPRFRSVEMQKTRFYDLRFQLGAGYLYCHQGDCKHTVVIRDMRLIHPEDIQNRAAYPILIFQHKFRAKKCDVCDIYRATRVTLDDKWAKENPCYFCENCYYMLHYSENGLLLYNHTVYDYHPD